MTTPPRKTFTPAIIAAIVGLLALAVVTVVVVLNSGDSSDPGTGTEASGSKDPSSDSSSSNPGDGIASSDDAFTYQLPKGYEEALDKIDTSGAVAAAYAPDSDKDFATTIVITSEPAKGTPLDEIVQNGRDAVESSLDTTTDSLTPSMSDIDGEDVAAYATGDYDKNGVTLRSAIVVTVHNDTAYAFIVNVKSDKTSDGGDALFELINSVTWN